MIPRDTCRRLLATAALLMLFSTAGAAASDSDRQPGTATDAEVAALIRDLGDASYETRLAATRRLCAMGMPAGEQLDHAAKGGDSEVALRARRLLTVLDRLLFTGVDVSLAFSRSAVGWDEPVDLRVTLDNRTAYPARIPFGIDATARAALSDDAKQVGDMLDVAEWLHVRGAGGRELELRVDGIQADPSVVAAVNRRLKGQPVSTLAAGAKVTVTATVFNRGWARYPLLDSGEYSAVFEYLPEWEDEVLRAEQVGRVTSSPATIKVTTSAPEAVSRGALEASLALKRDGRFLAVLLTNKTDQPAVVNKNFGRVIPFAQGQWVYTLGGDVRELNASPKQRDTWADFKESLLVEVAPGQAIELARADINDIRQGFARLGAEVTDPQWTLHFTYVSLCNRQWQDRQGPALLGNENAPGVLRTPLPRRILATRQASNAIKAPRMEPVP